MPSRIRVVATDIDGTLTERRGNLLLSLEAVKAIRMLEARGIPVVLVSGNSIPVVAGLARYLGSTGPSVAENGCVLFWRGSTIHLCQGAPSRRLVESILSLGFRESWQNPYRYHDKAFLASSPEEAWRLLPEVRRLAESEGMRVLWSGYAVHIQPRGGGKGRGVVEAARLLGRSVEELAVVGDGENDLDMFLDEAFKACPGDAAEEVKRKADYVAREPGGRGFAEIAHLIAEGRALTSPERRPETGTGAG